MLPDTSSKYQANDISFNEKISHILAELTKIAEEERCDLGRLVKILLALPFKEEEGMNYLEAASQCILDISCLVDETFPALPSLGRVAIKYRLMGKLAVLKAEQIA